MPLLRGTSDEIRQANIHTLMGEIGKSPHVQSREQALAIAYAKQRSGRAEGGVVDHDNDPDLPRNQEPVRMIDMMPLSRGYEDPAYLQTIYRLLRQQQQLNTMYPQLNTMHPMVQRELLRRYWLGGYLGGYR